MEQRMENFYRLIGPDVENCFYVEIEGELSFEERELLRYLLAETFAPELFSSRESLLEPKSGEQIVEVGPRLNFATAWNTNALSVFSSVSNGQSKIRRIERSRRVVVPAGKDVAKFLNGRYDRMTEMPYEEPLATFQVSAVPEKVYTIPFLEKGPDALLAVPGLAMDANDRQFYYDYFVGKCRRDPTIVEILDLNNANSQHSRHDYFKGRQVIDGVVMPETLMEIVQSTWKANHENSLIAFCDNSSGIRGYTVEVIMPATPGKASRVIRKKVRLNIIFTAETHNFPSGIAPRPGAETGTGGRIRDVQATGRGGWVLAGTAGYCVGNLRIPGYVLPWENDRFYYPGNMASPLQILIEASNGASDYGNKFGEPVIQGFTRSFGLRLPAGERQEWIKPIMFTGGVGQIDDRHVDKNEAEKGFLIVQIGGPAYRIGFGGGAASSLLQGENVESLDFNAVQRGDAQMEQKMNRVVRACVEMGGKNPIEVIHDQGAGGPANVLKELVEKSGGRIGIRKIVSGDPTLSVLELWVAEYQERNGLLIRSERIAEFQRICRREKVTCEILGRVTGDGRFVVIDSQDKSVPVDLHLKDVLSGMPQKEFRDKRVAPELDELFLDEKLTIQQALERVLRLVTVGSKRFLTNKVDRSVTGLVVQQQCCGPLQLPVADVAVTAQSYFGKTGAAIAIGEQPIKGLIDAKAGARMSVGEMLTNIVWAKSSGIKDIKCSGNWMWAPKLRGEGARIYDAACAARDLMVKLGIAIDGGKDSLSMATIVNPPKGKGHKETVKSPGELVVSGYVTVPDIEKVVTPDIKRPGDSHIFFIDLAGGKNRLGGSALAQCFSQLGDETPDVEDAGLLKRAYEAIQHLIGEGAILAGHDRSDGGLITTLLEMAFAGNCGLEINLGWRDSVIEKLFSEELGLVVECAIEDLGLFFETLEQKQVPYEFIAVTTKSKEIVVEQDNVLGEVVTGKKEIFNESMPKLRELWEETSYQLERLQADPQCVAQEKRNIFERSGPRYALQFKPQRTFKYLLKRKNKPRVAIIREEGSNGDREMTAAFMAAGFEAWDITMTDLLNRKINLDRFRGVVFVGGFSYADVFDSAKGWAAIIQFKLRKMFDKFRRRQNTFSLGVCNGCQLMALLGWVPFKKVHIETQPRFIHNRSGRFESRWATVKILPSPAIMLKGMENSALGVWVAHGEGRINLVNPGDRAIIDYDGLAPIQFVDDDGYCTEKYPFNPNGSEGGITALCSADGRHLAMMPHPERVFLKWQWPWMPAEWKGLKASPWLQMFQNARTWCEEE